MVDVLDKGFVTDEGFLGGDLTVVNSAKVSFNKRSTEVGGKEVKLINYLMKHRHGTPFEHSVFTFHVKAPIFVTREWQRHRIGSFNEMSGRYVKFEPEFYEPGLFRVPAATNKQGSVLPEISPIPATWPEVSTWNVQMKYIYRGAVEDAYAAYEELIDFGVAKELARNVLPVSLYTEFFWTVNARSLMNFLSLRNSDDAQWEIRQYAVAIEDIFKERMPVTYDAWIENERLAP